jgi:hypothetical protein
MSHSRQFSLAALFLLSAGLARPDTLLVPRMPSPEFVPAVVSSKPWDMSEVRTRLEQALGGGSVLVQDLPPPTAGPDATAPSFTRGEPHPVAATLGRHPVIDLADSHYAPLQHTFIPAMMDWFEALLAGLGYTPAQAWEAGFRSNKAARLMRVFTSVRMHRDHGHQPDWAPAIGWCRILLREDWGRCRKGETHSFVLVGTDRGWFVIDPATRRLRAVEPNDQSWLVEFVVL